MNTHTDVERLATSDAPAAAPQVSREPRTINLALQGGGAHGAFSWGVIDRLLD